MTADPVFPELLERAEAALAMGRLYEAEQAARSAIAEEPGSERGHALLSRAYLLAGRLDDALEASHLGLAGNPASPSLLCSRAAALVDAGRWREALAAAEDAVGVAPGDSAPHHLRSLALRGMGRGEEARASAALAVELAPEDAGCRTHLGDVWLEIDAARAEAHYRAALALDPERAWALNNLGVALLRQGRTADASFAFRTALLVDPAFPQAKLNAFRTAVSIRRGGPWALAMVGGLWLAGVALIVHGFVASRVWEFGGGFAVLVLQLGATAVLSRAGERRLGAVDPELHALQAKVTADLDRIGLRAVGFRGAKTKR